MLVVEQTFLEGTSLNEKVMKLSQKGGRVFDYLDSRQDFCNDYLPVWGCFFDMVDSILPKELLGVLSYVLC